MKASIGERVKQTVAKAAEQVAVKRIRLGVTGFSGSGKTVYLGALVQALLTAHNHHLSGPLAGFGYFERGVLRAVRIRDDLHPTSPQFPFRTVRDSLLGADNRWPEPTTRGSSRPGPEAPPEALESVCEWRSAHPDNKERCTAYRRQSVHGSCGKEPGAF